LIVQHIVTLTFRRVSLVVVRRDEMMHVILPADRPILRISGDPGISDLRCITVARPDRCVAGPRADVTIRRRGDFAFSVVDLSYSSLLSHTVLDFFAIVSFLTSCLFATALQMGTL